MASSITDGSYKLIEGLKVSSYTQQVRCAKCGKTVGFIQKHRLRDGGPMLCTRCATVSETSEMVSCRNCLDTFERPIGNTLQRFCSNHCYREKYGLTFEDPKKGLTE